MERRIFLAAGALVAALATDACAKGGASELEIVEEKANFDYASFVKLVERPGAAVHQLWDIDGYVPRALGAIKSAYNGYQFGYGIAPDSIAMLACLHGYANAFAYNDSMWAKYKIGEAFGFKDPSGNVVPTNIFFHARSQQTTTADPNDMQSMYQDGTIEALQRRGLNVLVCHTAAAEQARTLVAAGAAPQGSAPPDVLKDLLANLMPGVTVVPSMVATVGILQNRFKYAYTSVSVT
jgi:intracellular sulfur oxidation DsrE/DsrF family protein